MRRSSRDEKPSAILNVDSSLRNNWIERFFHNRKGAPVCDSSQLAAAL
jgi:hypothetical protein